LITVVFDNGRLPEKKSESKRQESGIRDMDNVGGSNVTNQFQQPGPTNHGKW
jgi:hypothetical protein